MSDENRTAKTPSTPRKKTNKRGAESGEKERERTATNVLREHAEQQFAHELEELVKVDTRQRPPNWQLSPWAVMTYLLGGSWIMVLWCRLSILAIAELLRLRLPR